MIRGNGIQNFAIISSMSHEKPKLYIICGLPGSGKTTLAKQIVKETPAVRLCPDEWMEDMDISLWDSDYRYKLEKRLWKLGQELLRLGQSVVIEFGSWAKSERDEILLGGRASGAIVQLYCLDPPLNEIRTRLSARGMECDDIIPGKLAEYSDKFERPDIDELKLYDNHPEVR